MPSRGLQQHLLAFIYGRNASERDQQASFQFCSSSASHCKATCDFQRRFGAGMFVLEIQFNRQGDIYACALWLCGGGLGNPCSITHNFTSNSGTAVIGAFFVQQWSFLANPGTFYFAKDVITIFLLFLFEMSTFAISTHVAGLSLGWAWHATGGDLKQGC